MGKFLDTIILDNSIRRYLAVIAFIIFILIFKRWVSRYIASLLFLIINKNWKSIQKGEFVDLIVKPLGWFITILVAVISIDKLNFPSAWDFKIYGEPFNDILSKLGNSLIVLFFTLFLIRFINFISLIFEHRSREEDARADGQLIIFFRDFLKMVVGIFGLLGIIKVGFNQNVGAILTGLSIVGAALALAAKESLENLIASFIIFFDKPFYTGDLLKVNDISGTVEHIGLRSTRIRTVEQTLVTIPNKQMVDNAVDNISKLIKRRGLLRLEFSVRTTADQIKTFIEFSKSLLDTYPGKITNYTVTLIDLSKTGLSVTIEYFTIPFTYAEYLELKQEINMALLTEISNKQLELSPTISEVNIINKTSPPKPSSII